MQKSELNLKIGSYEVVIHREKTREEYEKMPLFIPEKSPLEKFVRLYPTAPAESRAFLEELGIQGEKISSVRLLSQPDENGEVLYLCNVRLCGKVLKGGDITPRQSVEKAGLALVFVGNENSFSPSARAVSSPQVEMRFVIPLLDR